MISALTSAGRSCCGKPTTVGQEHDSAQLRQNGFHGLEISEAHRAVAFSTNEEHGLFHSKAVFIHVERFPPSQGLDTHNAETTRERLSR